MMPRKITSKVFGWFRRDVDVDFLESYRKLLFGQYTTLSNPISNPEAKEEADRITKMSPEEIEWEDLYRLELAIIKLEPEELLRRRVWILRNEYREIASTDEVKDYDLSKPPDAATGNEKELRADAIRLQEELNWRYIVMTVFESFRGQIIKMLVLGAGALLVVIALLACFWAKATSGILASSGVNLSVLGIIIVPGILGGLISTLRTVQKAQLSRNADIDLSELEEGKLGIYLSPLLGGIFALLLFCLFAGDFMTGNLFPKVSFNALIFCEEGALECVEIPKLIIWCFIAGFAEQFVPDRLAQFTKENSKDSQKNSPKKETGQ